jgi:hypothetical protein
MITITLPVRIDLAVGHLDDGPSCNFTVGNVLFDESPKNGDMIIFTDISSSMANRVLFSVEHFVHYVNPESSVAMVVAKPFLCDFGILIDLINLFYKNYKLQDFKYIGIPDDKLPSQLKMQ